MTDDEFRANVERFDRAATEIDAILRKAQLKLTPSGALVDYGPQDIGNTGFEITELWKD